MPQWFVTLRKIDAFKFACYNFSIDNEYLGFGVMIPRLMAMLSLVLIGKYFFCNP